MDELRKRAGDETASGRNRAAAAPDGGPGAEIRQRLERAFSPTRLEVIDESELHRGHAGYRDGGQSHFRVILSAPELATLSRIARHRAVHQALGPNLVARIHALALEISG